MKRIVLVFAIVGSMGIMEGETLKECKSKQDGIEINMEGKTYSDKLDLWCLVKEC